VSAAATPELSVGWIDPRVGLGRIKKKIFSGLGWVVGRKNCLSNAYAKLTR